jgi:hypothetical protein
MDITLDLINEKKVKKPEKKKNVLKRFIKIPNILKSLNQPKVITNDHLSLVADDFRFLNFQDIICPRKIFKHILSSNSDTKCICEPESDQFEIIEEFGYLLKDKCLKCHYIMNRKLIITLFTRTGTKKNCTESDEKIKMLTDCTLFTGGFTGKDDSSYLLLGNSSYQNFSEIFQIQKTFKRKRSHDYIGFEVIGDENKKNNDDIQENDNTFNDLDVDGFKRKGSWLEMDSMIDQSSERRSSFVYATMTLEERKKELYLNKTKTKLFYLDPHYIQVSLYM